MNDWTVAVTGMNAKPDNPGPGYAVARCLRRFPGFSGKIIGLGYDVLDPGLYHPEIDAGYLVPYPAAGHQALLERILEIHWHQPLDAVIPCLDAELQSFIRIAGELARHGIRSLLPTASALTARGKDRLASLCHRLGLRTPETRLVTDPASFESRADYPLVVKGIFYDATVVRNPLEARAAFHRLAAQWGYPVLVQPFVAGQEFNLAALGDGRGGMLGPVMMRKRALTDKGKAWAGISVIDGELQDMATRLVGELQWSGPLEVEALRSQQGELYLIEVNPRFPAWVYLTQGVGRNLPAALLRLMAGEAEPRFPPPRAGTLFIRYADEVIVDLETFEGLFVHGTRLVA